MVSANAAKLATGVLCAALVGIDAGCSTGRARADEPSPPAAGRRGPSPREMLEPFGIDEDFFSGFADDRPLDAREREKLLALVYRVGRIPPRRLEEHARPPYRLRLPTENPSAFRGDVFWVPGFVRNVTREELKPEAREKFPFDALYRCGFVTLLGMHMTFYTPVVPADWKLDEPIDEPAGAFGLFVKILGEAPSDADPGASGQSLLLVAPRMAWYPRNLLGNLKMDAGLFDDVRDRTGLDERECFYQLLAAVSRANPGYIERRGRRELARRRDLLERLARNRELGPKARAKAERALERAEQGADDVTPLFNEPAAQRGRLFVLTGDALRAVEVRVDDPDVQARFGIDRYYEVDIVTPDSQNNPVVCCVAELPPDMPRGESIHENVRVCGIFLKSWAFDSRKTAGLSAPDGGARPRQLAPLLVAKTVDVIHPLQFGPPSATLIVFVAVAVVVLAVLVWQVRQGDRQALARAEHGDAPPQIDLDQAGFAPDE